MAKVLAENADYNFNLNKKFFRYFENSIKKYDSAENLLLWQKYSYPLQENLSNKYDFIKNTLWHSFWLFLILLNKSLV
jgi:hypothetical protein